MAERIRVQPKHRIADHASNRADGRASSRVSTGRILLPTNDGRSVWARIMRDTMRSLIAHCGDAITEPQRIACRRIAALEAELIAIEDRIAGIRRKRKEPAVSLLAIYSTLSAQQLRLSKQVGWDAANPKPSNEPEDLASYINSKSNGHARKGAH